jgi:hypothetical protein
MKTAVCCSTMLKWLWFHSTSISSPGRIPRLTILLVAMLCLPQPSRGTTPGGATLSWKYYAYGSLYLDGGSFVANGTVGGTFSDPSDTYFNIIADSSSITFDYSVLTKAPGSWSSSELSLAPTIHNGIAINMVSDLSFVSVTLDPATTMAGFSTGNFSFTADQIQVDWQNLPFDNTTVVKLDIVIVPEPNFACLLLAGLVAAVAVRWIAKGITCRPTARVATAPCGMRPRI